MELSTAAGWNQAREDWQRVLELEAEGCFGVEVDGRIVATATAVCYEKALAWIGMVLTHPDARRKGHARRAMEAALEWLDGTGVAASRLDATDMGRPLYEALGYRVECEVQRWRGENQEEALPGKWGPVNPDLDREATGTDRSRVLRALGGEGWVGQDGGFVMHRPGRLARYLGPCLARSAEEARGLMRRAVRAVKGPMFWDLPESNAAAVGLAREFGFSPVRQLKRMARGDAPEERLELIYGLSGFETG